MIVLSRMKIYTTNIVKQSVFKQSLVALQYTWQHAPESSGKRALCSHLTTLPGSSPYTCRESLGMKLAHTHMHVMSFHWALFHSLLSKWCPFIFTPLSILKAMKERLERRGPPITWELSLRNKWRSEVIPPLFLHASSCGSLTAVKYFINNGYEPNMRCIIHMSVCMCEQYNKLFWWSANFQTWVSKSSSLSHYLHNTAIHSELGLLLRAAPVVMNEVAGKPSVEGFLAYHGQGKCKAEHGVNASSLTVLVVLKHLTFT